MNTHQGANQLWFVEHTSGCGGAQRPELPVTTRARSQEAPHGPATWLASCVLGVARRFECSEVAQTAYGACGSDRRSVGAWTERAPNLRGREGVKQGPVFIQPSFHSAFTVKCKQADVFSYYPPLSRGGRRRSLAYYSLIFYYVFVPHDAPERITDDERARREPSMWGGHPGPRARGSLRSLPGLSHHQHTHAHTRRTTSLSLSLSLSPSLSPIQLHLRLPKLGAATPLSSCGCTAIRQPHGRSGTPTAPRGGGR